MQGNMPNAVQWRDAWPVAGGGAASILASTGGSTARAT